MQQPQSVSKYYIGDLTILNFYRFHAYRITDASGNVTFNAEPASQAGAYGVTRTGNTLEEVKKQLIDDCKFLNELHRKDFIKDKALVRRR